MFIIRGVCMSEEFLYENYLHLFSNKYDMQKMFNAICSGKLNCKNPRMKKYLDILAKKGELLNFISFLNDANKFTYTVTIGRDSFDPLAYSYTSTKKEIRGFGGSEKSCFIIYYF